MTLDRDTEQRRLEEIAGDSLYAIGCNGVAVRYAATIFARHWQGSTCLELGPAEGLMTERLVEAFDEVEAVEGSATFAADLARRLPQVSVHHALFEEFDPGRTYDTILLGSVLEHVDDPVALMARARGWLAPGGRVILACPNARSLHRQAGVLMGVLEHEYAFTEHDRHNGHRRVYDPERLRADVRGAGLGVVVSGGYWLKPMSNAQIDASWEPALIDASMVLGERYPDIAAVIYVVAET